MTTRSPAAKIRIKDVYNGEFVKSSSRLEPSYIVTKYGTKIARLRILATVASRFEAESGDYVFAVLDDGTDTIAVRAFKETKALLDGIRVGDIVDVFGKPREYLGEKYLIPEVLRKIDDPNWELVRRLELMLRTPPANESDFSSPQRTAPAAEISEEVVVSEENSLIAVQEPVKEPPIVGQEKGAPGNRETEGENTSEAQRILRLIVELNEGDGAKYVSLLKMSNLSEEALESVVAELLGSGHIYEPKIGRFKKIDP